MFGYPSNTEEHETLLAIKASVEREDEQQCEEPDCDCWVITLAEARARLSALLAG